MPPAKPRAKDARSEVLELLSMRRSINGMTQRALCKATGRSGVEIKECISDLVNRGTIYKVKLTFKLSSKPETKMEKPSKVPAKKPGSRSRNTSAAGAAAAAAAAGAAAAGAAAAAAKPSTTSVEAANKAPKKMKKSAKPKAPAAASQKKPKGGKQSKKASTAPTKGPPTVSSLPATAASSEGTDEASRVKDLESLKMKEGDEPNEKLQSAHKLAREKNALERVKVAFNDTETPYHYLEGDDSVVIKYNGMSLDALKAELRANEEKLTGVKKQLVQRCCDGFLNGSLPRCPLCGSRLVCEFEERCEYHCAGYYSAEAGMRVNCPYRAKQVVRGPWKAEGKPPQPRSPVRVISAASEAASAATALPFSSQPGVMRHKGALLARVPANDDIVALLRTLGKMCTSRGDNFRIRAYEQGALAVAALPFEITSGEALTKGAHKVPGIGASIARSIDEFLASGRTTCTRLEELGGNLDSE